jgi:hypothetical protein
LPYSFHDRFYEKNLPNGLTGTTTILQRARAL